MASSSSTVTKPLARHRWSYDVFLSFRGEDTRATFTNYLYANLQQKGINTFIDDEELIRGEQIGPALLKAIEESRMAVVVFSPNYATSSWCLDELTKIVECSESRGEMLIPIFYRVDPLEVQEQTGGYGKAIEHHKKRLGTENMKKVHSWRDALRRAATARAKGSGWYLNNGCEAEFVERIAQEVSKRIGRMLLYVAKHPVGIEFHLEELKSILSIESLNVIMAGIWGPGGMGKTTVAKAAFNLMAQDFEGSCFIGNVREASEHYNGLLHLQELLLSKILGDYNTRIDNIDHGKNLIMTRLHTKRVLIVLDDVDQPHQLEALAGGHDWFGLGSRIIITTRDDHILKAQGVKERYKMKGLNDDDALQLLSWHAFGIPSPAKDYEEVASGITNYAKGLPLALTILGCFLRGRSIIQWKWTMNRLKEIPDSEISQILQISFDSLCPNERAIFLDIACFLKGKNKDFVMKMLESCELFPRISIPVLVEKSLIYIDGNELHMHDLIQQMGQENVQRESPSPGRRSRLWHYKDVIHVLQDDTGTDVIEGVLVDMPDPGEICLNANAFAKMPNLRLLIVKNAVFSGRPTYLPNGLRWLEWSGYPSTSMPPGFHPNKLAVFQLQSTSITQLWQSFKRCSNLTIMELTNCESLREIPDVSMIPNLEKLIVNQCTSLVKVHESVGFLEKLVFLNFGDCVNLQKLPAKLKLKSLDMLRLTRCPRLDKFPDIVGSMEKVSSIDLSDTAIEELPSSIGKLTGLQHMDLHSCRNLKFLPSSIYSLQNVEELNLNGCSMLLEFPSAELPSGFPMLDFLDVSNTGIVKLDFLETPNCFTKLETLDLSGNNLVTLSSCMSRFDQLKFLHLKDCKQLREISELPPGLNHVNARGCESLDVQGLQKWKLQATNDDLKIDFSNCHKLGQLQVANELLDKVFFGETEFHFILPGSDIPQWFCHRSAENSVLFKVHSVACQKLVGLAASAVFCLPEDEESSILTCDVIANGEILSSKASSLESLESDHVWLGYIPLAQCSNEMLNGRNELEVSFKFLDDNIEESSNVKLKACGVRFVGDSGEEEMNDSAIVRVLCPDSSRVFGHDAADMLVDMMEEAQFSENQEINISESDHILLPETLPDVDAPAKDSASRSHEWPQKKVGCNKYRMRRTGVDIGLGLRLRPSRIKTKKSRKKRRDRRR